NEAISIVRRTFLELGFKERKHLQEWICKNTNMLGERLLIIQKEFSGFDDTNERLDILAIDENGDLVIIENKLDDTGRDVTWQALKYVSYCAGLTKTDIRDIFQKYLDAKNATDVADHVLSEFLGIEDYGEAEINKGDQRIILIAASFRKEVTSTVMWLLDHNVKIKCIKVTPYTLGESVLLDTEQIIPVKDAEEYLIKLANKKQEELIISEKNKNRYTVRQMFWTRLLEKMNEQSTLFKNISPSKDNWITCGSGHSGIGYGFVITGNFSRVELWINKGPKEENKEIFDRIYTYKDQIEEKFGHELDWQRLDDGKGSRIGFYQKDVSVFNEDDWDKMIEFLVNNMIYFEKSIRDVLHNVVKK
ncbi:MAG: DUF4268 domain-containing protein, partial [Saccharofermentanales bacterium]